MTFQTYEEFEADLFTRERIQSESQLRECWQAAQVAAIAHERQVVDAAQAVIDSLPDFFWNNVMHAEVDKRLVQLRAAISAAPTPDKPNEDNQHPIYEPLDAGIAPLVKLLRENGVNTFSSCEGGEGHDFSMPTVRITPANPDDMRPQMDYISHLLSEGGYSGYYLKAVYAYQSSAVKWDYPYDFIEIEFWAKPDARHGVPRDQELISTREGKGKHGMNTIMRWLTRRMWNSIVHRIVLDAYHRNVIDSYQMHEILGAWNRTCWPEWSSKRS